MSRRIWDIPGGVHPAQNKSQSQKPIVAGPLPKELVLPLQQHIGAPADPVVEVGEYVFKGQLIAQGKGFVSSPVHASSSGTIKAIEPRPVLHASRLDSPCIVIETDGKDEWADRQGMADYQTRDRATILQNIRDAGIVGMGGAGFPTAVKLGIKPDTHIEQLILNAVECEPYITADDMLIRERADEIVAGLEIMAWLVEPDETLIGIEDNKPEAIQAFRAATEGKPIEVVVIPTKYPSGGEKQLIHILTGKEVPSGGLPTDVGVVCQNTGTAYAIKRAVIDGEPLISRITTVTGEAVHSKGNYEVLIGTPVVELLEFAGLDKTALHRLIMGGPMMGFTIHNAKVPVVKTTNCLLAATVTELPDPAEEQPCIRCGSCAQACPVNLLPQQLYWFAKAREFDKALLFNLPDCIECGACAYVCPSNIPLVQYYRFAKGQIRVQQEEARKADHARERFEFRQRRLEKEEQEKEARRKARAAAAAKKQAAKKAAPAKATSTTGAAGADDLQKLKASAASTLKRWKDAEKALKAAQSNGSEHIEALTKKVEQLKAKADAAKAALKEAQAKHTDKQPVTDSSTAKAADPMATLKLASAEDFKAYKAAVAELEQAEANGADNLDALREKVQSLKAKSDASKKAMKEARAKEKERIQKQKAAKDPLKALKIEAAVAQKNLQKAKRALESAGNEDDIAALQEAFSIAEEKARQTQASLEQAQES